MPVDLDAPMDDFDAPSDDKSKQTSKTLFIESVVKRGFSREGVGDTSVTKKILANSISLL
ncbi:hypothetical protein BJV82DRAFT_666768 [Fennellomyces sp. T-0311]|nr:hypothetical protein BJV82DRAFT_666768 [Fennellomyces sp. T-0311]